MDNFNKNVIATLIDFAEAGLVEPGFDEMHFNLILDLGFNSPTSNMKKLSQKYSGENLPNLKLNKIMLSQNTLTRENINNKSIISNAEKVANEATDIQTLENNIRNYEGFYSIQGSSGMVFATGNSEADVLVVSEPPGREEEIQSLPYAGLAGELFNKIFAAVKLDIFEKKSSGIYVLPVVPFRLVKGSNEKTSDFDLIEPFLKRHIEIFSPKYIILIGKIPSAILSLSGQFQANEENGFIGSYLGIPTIEIEGIRSMMKSPERKRRTWNNLKLLRKLMDQNNE